MHFKDLEKSLFDIKVRPKITMVAMREYIENLSNKSLIKIIELDQEEEFVTDQLVRGKENIKNTPTTK
jgi:hypothetical protein